ncbi:MAG: ABC transporter ATP-binding protein [Pseudomonadota bacterium]
MPESARIQLHRVTRTWGDSPPAVDNVEFTVEPGQFVILLGPSGCGKSTTLRLIAGLESTTHGRISIDDHDVTEAPPGTRGIAMVFQSYALFPHLTVADNIVFGLKSRRVPKPDRARRLQETATLVGLEPYLDRKPAQLSGGQRQRVALARAIISENRICLMDEPLSNLDARLRNEMRRELKALQRRLGITVIYVTHDQVEAMSMGDRVLLMESGRLIQDGTPDDLYNFPVTTFAALFLGSPPMNLLPLAPAAGGAAIDGLAEHPVAKAEAAGCQLGVRPEDLVVAAADGDGLPAEIVTGEYLGADTVLHLQLGSAAALARMQGRFDTTPGTPVRVSWPLAKAHLFDGETGERSTDTERLLATPEHSPARGAAVNK